MLNVLTVALFKIAENGWGNVKTSINFVVEFFVLSPFVFLIVLSFLAFSSFSFGGGVMI